MTLVHTTPHQFPTSTEQAPTRRRTFVRAAVTATFLGGFTGAGLLGLGTSLESAPTITVGALFLAAAAFPGAVDIVRTVRTRNAATSGNERGDE